MKKFNKNKISFEYPESWNIADEEWDDDISALTFEDGEGIFMIDIYHSTNGPELENYAIKHYQCFKQELPFLSKVISGPTYERIDSGIMLEFTTKTYLILKSDYLNPVFKVQCENSVSYISGQFEKRDGLNKVDHLRKVVGSYSAA
ncbi:hypothetical protein FE810_15545 [Thalassotalea litorea]|uniref:DUF1795 domain-containing protein n=1 Tax=Thalassotalea litorea TaxID=2020715 RepID=A0A5R9IBV2_9GAMM|nr:hypothetical protein [Thalassotalea litorea]TLU61085.1 hypothetical protein FE810_15545 [Thalassotalea litorea]